MQRQLLKIFRQAALPVAAAAMAVTSAHAAQNPGATTGSTSAATQAQGGPAASKQDVSYRGMRATKVIGTDVRNSKGKDIGEITDLIVDMRSGDVRYAVMTFDPGILSAEKLFAVPAKQLRLGKDREEFVYDVSKDKLESASINRSDWNAMFFAKPERIASLDKAWGIRQPTDGASAHRVSDLIGKDVHSRSGEDIGDIKDLVINMAAPKVHYAVLAFDPSWTTPEKNFAFPMSAFQLGKDRDDLVLDVDKSRIQSMRSFDASRLANLNDPSWVRDVDVYLVTVLPPTDRPRNASASNAHAASGKTDASHAGSVSERFGKLDTDGNGLLDRDEAKSDASVRGQWQSLDKNGDGRISRQEFSAGDNVAAGNR
ncbi:PRC-barrel domain-containing protein [Rhizobacter fulvus]